MKANSLIENINTVINDEQKKHYSVTKFLHIMAVWGKALSFNICLLLIKMWMSGTNLTKKENAF